MLYLLGAVLDNLFHFQIKPCKNILFPVIRNEMLYSVAQYLGHC